MLSDRLIAVTGGGSHLYDYGKAYPQITGGWNETMQYSDSYHK